MKFKKLSISAIALSTILLTVGCNSNNSGSNTNTQASTEKVESTETSSEKLEEVKSKYDNNLQVKVFFDLVDKTKDMTITEFIDAVKAMDTNNILSIEEVDPECAPPISPLLKFYDIKSSDSNVQLRVAYTDAEGEKELASSHLKIEDIELYLPDENLNISCFNADDYTTGNFTVTLESTDPIITKENISKFKTLNEHDEKYFKLQEKFIANKKMTTEDIKKLWNCEQDERIDICNAQLDMPEGVIDSSVIQFKDKDDWTEVMLKGKTDLVSALTTNSDIQYGYDSKEMVHDEDLALHDDKYVARLFFTDKNSLVSNIEKLYALKSK